MTDLAVARGRHDAAQAELEPILAALRSHFPDADDDIIIHAYDLAQSRHAGQFRLTGDPYITHPIAVAQILAEYGLDPETIAAGLLHDTVEDTDLTLDEVERMFGENVARITDGVTKLDGVEFDITREEAQAETIRKMVVSMAQDVRVLIIKLADRLHNLRTIYPLPVERQQVKARESLEIYAPLAHRMGFQEVKHEMENLCFEILYPGRYQEIEDLIRRRAPEREAVIDQVMSEAREMLARVGIDAVLKGRPKHHYSIYRKMVDSRLPFEDIHDLIGIRILVEVVKDCYGALGLVHSRWTPVQGRFKDYIALPKFNLYQSLHTTVIGPDGKPLEVQIRTHDMDTRAEFGIAAHWRYKEGVASTDLAWMVDLRNLPADYDDPAEFLANLKLDLYEDLVFVLTPQGDVKTLPRGATPVDFAYSVHTEVGHRCVGARVNGRLVTLATELQSGDIVEIITTKSDDSGPTRDWLGFVRTSKARSKIKQWFSRARRKESLQRGRDSVQDLIRRDRVHIVKNERSKVLHDAALALGYRDTETMYIAVGDGAVAPQTVVGRIKRVLSVPVVGEDLGTLDPVRRRTDRPAGEGVIVEGFDDVWVRIARCCSPVPGDDLVGFVTIGRGVSIHRTECSNIQRLAGQEERMIEASWAPGQLSSFSAWIQVEALDRPNLLRDITSVISDAGANIVGASSRTDRDRVAVLRYEVELSDPGQLDRLLAGVRRIASVYDAFRLRPG